MRRVWESPNVVLVKVLFCKSPTTVEGQGAVVWDMADEVVPQGARQVASASRHNLVFICTHYRSVGSVAAGVVAGSTSN